MGLKGSLRKGPESEWQGAVFRPLEKGHLFQKGFQKWTLLESKVVPPGGSVFWPLHVHRCAEALQAHVCEIDSHATSIYGAES